MNVEGMCEIFDNIQSFKHATNVKVLLIGGRFLSNFSQGSQAVCQTGPAMSC